MLSHQFRSGRSALAGTLVALSALGALGVSASPAVAAETSIFIAYPARGFGGTPTNISGCGTHNMPYHVQSYQWIARGQSGLMYNTRNATGVHVFVLPSNSNASQTTPVGWRSIFILC